MIHEFINPIPVKTPKGDGMAIYVTSSGTFANDIWTVALNDQKIRHFRTDQLTIERNFTFNLNQNKS